MDLGDRKKIRIDFFGTNSNLLLDLLVNNES
jgi:hypothetical protein